MRRLKDLKPSITRIPQSEGLDLIRYIRTERKKIKVTEGTVVRRAKAKAAVDPIAIMKAHMKKMSPEQLSEMKRKFGL